MTQHNTYDILWADDDPDDLMLMRGILAEQDRDFSIVEVPNGRAALEFLEDAFRRQNLPCLIILDINMPVLDGKETLVRIKESPEYASLPVVVFTTSSSELDKLFCQKYNVEMITKPPEYLTLKQTVTKLLSYCKR